MRIFSKRSEAVANYNFDYDPADEGINKEIKLKMQEKYQEDWFNISMKWLNEATEIFNDSFHQIEENLSSWQTKYSKVNKMNADLTAKYEDVKLQHDQKTELASKLIVKSFIAFTEIRRVTGEKD